MFTKKTKLIEIFNIAKGEEILYKHGVPCVTCPMAKFEMDYLNLGQIADMYDVDLISLLKELNEHPRK